MLKVYLMKFRIDQYVLRLNLVNWKIIFVSIQENFMEILAILRLI